MSSRSPTFRDLKASFESRSKATTGTTGPSAAGDLANMSVQPQRARVPTLAKTIDSVLDTPAASPSVRPSAKLRPSWIGPLPSERPVTPGLQAMTQHVTVEYSSPGLQPPLYICTNLSDPEWEPVEMHREADEHGHNTFSKAFQVEVGEYQYKFRLGEGDWWVCDDSKPTVDDGQGNKNNLLVVTLPPIPKTEQAQTAPSSPVGSTVGKQTTSPPLSPAVALLPQPTLTSDTTKSEQSSTEPSGAAAVISDKSPPLPHLTVVSIPPTSPQPVSVSTPAKAELPKAAPMSPADTPADTKASSQAPAIELRPQTSHQPEHASMPAPLMKHETLRAPNSPPSAQTPGGEELSSSESEDESPQDSHEEMLMKHETFKPQAEKAQEFLQDGDESSSSSSENDDHDDGKADSQVDTAPIRQATIAKSQKKQGPSPLLHHETMKGLPPLVVPEAKSAAKPVLSTVMPHHADPDDTSLERFPTHHAGIIELIMDTHQRLPEDETSDEDLGSSPVSQTISESSASANSLPCVREAEREMLAEIREAEEEEVEREEADGEEVDPLNASEPITSHMTPSQEPKDPDFASKIAGDVPQEKIEIEEHIIIEVVDERKGLFDVLLDKIGGTGNAIAMTVGLLVIAAGICTMSLF